MVTGFAAHVPRPQGRQALGNHPFFFARRRRHYRSHRPTRVDSTKVRRVGAQLLTESHIGNYTTARPHYVPSAPVIPSRTMSPPPPPLPPPKASGLSLALLAFACDGGGRIATVVGQDHATGEASQSAGGDSSGGQSTQPDGGGAGNSSTQATGGTDSSPGGSSTVSPTQGAGEGSGGTGAVLAIPEICEPADVGEGDDQIALMRPFAVRHADFAQRVIYSWTTAEQIDELRSDPTLLTRSMTAEGERGRAADVLEENASADEVAAVLARAEYANKRFGWSNPWATLLGWGAESYGDRLIRIVLKDTAWVARLILRRGSDPEWEFASVDGTPVSRDDVLADPSRLAAVYFVDLREYGCGTLGSRGSSFREYFVHNEQMIASWEVYTPLVRQELDRGIEALRELDAALTERRCGWAVSCWDELVFEHWEDDATPRESLVTEYLASLALPAPEYWPVDDRLAQLLQALDAVPFDDPLEHTYP